MEALEKFESSGTKYGLGWAHFLLTQIHYEKDDYINALVHAQSSLDYRKDIGNKQEMALTLRWIITLLLEEKNFDCADSYLEQIKELTESTDDMIIDQSYRLSEALILKAKARPKYWMKAIDRLEDLVVDKIVDYGIKITALILLCELLLNGFSFSGDSEVLLELEKYTEMIENIAKDLKTYNLRLEASNIRLLTMWLKA